MKHPQDHLDFAVVTHSHDNLCPAGFLARLRSEMRLRDTLVGAPLEIPSELVKQIMALRAEESGAARGGGGAEVEARLSLGTSRCAGKGGAQVLRMCAVRSFGR